MDNNLYMVCIRCKTYNHGNFILDAMEGFAMQKTNFSYVSVIVDDASTDNNREIIQTYLKDNFVMYGENYYEKDIDNAHIIFARHKINENCYFAIVFLKENIYGKKSKRPYYSEWTDNSKYHALCEGDDYWTNPDKLQKQVDFLENNADYVLTCHRYKKYDYEENTWATDGHETLFTDETGISFNFQQNKGWLTKTLSIVYRADVLDEYYRFGSGLDYILIYFLMKNGKGYCFNDFWGVYRLSNLGIRSKKSLKSKVMREYSIFKKLYAFDSNPISRRLYYGSYASALFFTHGKLLFKEELDIRKLLSVFKYSFQKIVRQISK